MNKRADSTPTISDTALKDLVKAIRQYDRRQLKGKIRYPDNLPCNFTVELLEQPILRVELDNGALFRLMFRIGMNGTINALKINNLDMESMLMTVLTEPSTQDETKDTKGLLKERATEVAAPLWHYIYINLPQRFNDVLLELFIEACSMSEKDIQKRKGVPVEPSFDWVKTWLQAEANSRKVRLKTRRRGRPTEREHFINEVGQAIRLLRSKSIKTTQENVAEAKGCDVRSLRKRSKSYGLKWREVIKEADETGP